MNNLARIALCLALTAVHVFAFDPAGPPPKKTLTWTIEYLSKRILPKVEFVDCLVTDVPQLMQLDRPAEYGVAIDASRMTGSPEKRFTFTADNVSLLFVLTKLAERAGANLLIEPGKVTLIPKGKQ